MKALCRSCRTVGPTLPSVAESKAAAKAHRWNYTRRGGFLCPDCYWNDLGDRMERVEKLGMVLAAIAGSLYLIAFILFILSRIFES